MAIEYMPKLGFTLAFFIASVPLLIEVPCALKNEQGLWEQAIQNNGY